MSDKRLKILWVGDAVVSTGFAKVTHNVCARLLAKGHEVIILGLNYYGAPHNFPCKIYPAYDPMGGSKHHDFGEQRLPYVIAIEKPDIVLIQQDGWNIPGYFRYLEACGLIKSDYEGAPDPTIPCPPIVGYLAVDAENQSGSDTLNQLSHVITWTEFGERELINGGYSGTTSVAPLAVDRSIYYPRDRSESRAQILGDDNSPIPDSTFLVGVVGRNQVRKGLDRVLDYFAEWIQTRGINDAALFLHVAPTADKGVNLASLRDYYGLQGKVYLSSPPNVGYGVDESLMPVLYSAFDCLVSGAYAEGWNLPALEAMSCGVPCILPAQGGQGEWAEGAAYIVSATEPIMVAPVNAGMYTIGRIPDRQPFIEALDSMYKHWPVRDRLRSQGSGKVRSQGIAKAEQLSWERTTNMIEETLLKVLSAG